MTEQQKSEYSNWIRRYASKKDAEIEHWKLLKMIKTDDSSFMLKQCNLKLRDGLAIHNPVDDTYNAE